MDELNSLTPSDEPKLSEKALYDYQLIRRALDQNDPKAYEELMLRYYDSLFFTINKMVKNETDAEDLVMHSFGKAFVRLKQYSTEFAFSTWLFKIASNATIDFLRKKNNQGIQMRIDSNFDSDDYKGPVIDLKNEHPDPEENFIKKEKSEQIRALLDKLKPRYRMLVQLRYFEELSYEEIAVRTGLPVGTIKAQLFRSREALLKLLQSSGHAK
jgi:RNA polymerase sigma factor (sigma-70 family)